MFYVNYVALASILVFSKKKKKKKEGIGFKFYLDS